MRAVRYHEHGDVDVLRTETVPDPEPGNREVLARVHAASVNPMDTYLREGETYTPDRLPVIPGSDFAGVVEAVGRDVEGFEVGDRVFGAGVHHGGVGTYAEYVRAPVGQIAHLPGSVSFEAGAGAGHAGLTAWRSIVVYGDPDPAETCLVHGGSGGVGHIAVQLAAASGARVVATAGSPDRCERVRALGADVALEYTREDLFEAIRAVDPSGIDVIVDHRPEAYLDGNVDVAAEYGRIVLIDGHDFPASDFVRTRKKELTIHNTGATSHTPDVNRVLGKLGRLMDEGRLTVEVAGSFDFDEVGAAHRTVAEESYVGKVVVTP